jgi:hypothetical protein
MKTRILFFNFLCILTLSSQAQGLQRNSIPNSVSKRIGDYIKPARSGSEISIVPFKRDLFNPLSYEVKWDTMICYDSSSGLIPSRRVSRTYNLLGEPLVQLTEQLPQGNPNWVNLTNEIYTYDSEGHELSYLTQYWQNNAWVNFNKQEMIYDANGDNTNFKVIQWQSNKWVNSFQYYFYYNSNGLCDTQIYQSGIQDTLWVNYQLQVGAYDIHSSITSRLAYLWLNNGWEAYFRETCTNDTNVYGNQLTDLQQYWVNNSWVNSYFGISTHDTAGNYLTILSQQWQNNSWVNWQYDTRTFNSAGLETSELGQLWSNGSWVNSSLMLNVYDTSNNLLSETYKQWFSSQWVNQNKEQYTYDLWGNSMTGMFQTWAGSGWIPNNGILLVFADHQRDVKFTLQNIYLYSAIIDSIILFVEPNRSQPQITLFPNPGHTMVYVYSDLASTDPNGSIIVYDLRGQVVLSEPFIHEKTGLDIISLKPGVYCVRVASNRMTKVLKLVKE